MKNFNSRGMEKKKEKRQVGNTNIEGRVLG